MTHSFTVMSSNALRCMRALLLLTSWLATAAQAGDTLNGIKARGELRYGVSEGIAGFSEQDKTGRWVGIDADFCRAVAVAALGESIGRIDALSVHDQPLSRPYSRSRLLSPPRNPAPFSPHPRDILPRHRRFPAHHDHQANRTPAVPCG